MLPPALDARLRLVARKAGMSPEALIADLLDDIVADIVPRPAVAAVRSIERAEQARVPAS